MSGDEPGYVPPDHTSTVEFARPAPPPAAAEAESEPVEVTAADPPRDAPGEPEPEAAIVDPDATAPDPPDEAPGPDPGDRRIAGPPPPAADQHARAEAPPAMVPPALAGSAPKPPRGKGPVWPQRFAVLLALAAAVLVMAVALAAVSLLSGDGSDGGDDPDLRAPATRTPGSRAPSKTPTAGPTTSQPGARPAPRVGTVVTGNGITYQVVQRDDGYFEGRFVITNRTGRPMAAWRLSFDAPGADVRTVWDARLVHAGAHPVIMNADGADPIPPGGTMDVQFGASGTPAMPGACLVNGAACGF
ncbi:cellulose binding domain-containing protein [Actinomadura sp. NPDC048394]|uniref:cellulose binding domain-containing protein n=1 Tax=Actinomadura sp. NPDC048394 TaxID=3158223 RepID=UPI00340FA5C4